MKEYRAELSNKLTFSEWMNSEYGDDWPTNDEDLNIWYRYLEYVKDENDKRGMA